MGFKVTTTFLYIFILLLFSYSCKSGKSDKNQQVYLSNDTIVYKYDELHFDTIVCENELQREISIRIKNLKNSYSIKESSPYVTKINNTVLQLRIKHNGSVFTKDISKSFFKNIKKDEPLIINYFNLVEVSCSPFLMKINISLNELDTDYERSFLLNIDDSGIKDVKEIDMPEPE